MRPWIGYSVAGGNTWGKLGVVGAVTFSNKIQRQSELLRFLVNTGGGQAGIFTDYPDYESDTESARLGGVLNLAYSINPANKLIFRNTLTRETDKEARIIEGLNGGIDTRIRNERLKRAWSQEQLAQVSGLGLRTVQRIENGGKASLETIKALAHVRNRLYDLAGYDGRVRSDAARATPPDRRRGAAAACCLP